MREVGDAFDVYEAERGVCRRFYPYELKETRQLLCTPARWYQHTLVLSRNDETISSSVAFSRSRNVASSP